MKLNCEIVQDLLPLYEDNVCSPSSREAVAEHLKECEACRKLVEDTRNLPAPDAPPDFPGADQAVANSFKKVRRRWKLSLAAVLVLIPAVLLCLMFVNEYRAEGICFTNLDEIWVGSRFMNALEQQDWEKAVQYLDYDVDYTGIQEQLALDAADYLPDFVAVTIGEEVWYARQAFANRYLSDGEDALETWAYLAYNGTNQALIPEWVWDALPEAPEGTGFRLWESQWGSYYVDESTWEALGETEAAQLIFDAGLQLVPGQMYEDLKTELDALAEESRQAVWDMYGEYADMSQEEFVETVRTRYAQQLAALAEQGYTIKNQGFRDAYRVGARWVVSYSAQISDGREEKQLYFDLRMYKGQICIVAFSYRGEEHDWYDAFLDAFLLEY